MYFLRLQEVQIKNENKSWRDVALKNRLPILPVYIRTNADKTLTLALKGDTQTIEIEIGELIDYKSRLDVEEVYRNQFEIYDSFVPLR